MLDPSRRDLQSLVDYDLAGFDYTNLQRGENVNRLPPNMRLLVSNKKPTDLLGNPFGWKIMSARALAIVQDLVPDDDIQVLNPGIIDQKTTTPVLGYSLVNCLRVLSALAYRPEGELIYADRVVIKADCVPPTTHMFHLGEEPRHWIISEQLRQRLSELDGIETIATQTVP
jgi:hypothetical protein